MKLIEVKNGKAKLSVAVKGEGEAIVFLHAGVCDKRMFLNAHSAFVEWQTVSYDRRGFGQTSCIDEPFSHVDDLVAVLDHLKLECVHLVGCSQGARVAINLALFDPKRVKSLTLVGAAVAGAPQPKEYDLATTELMAAIDQAEDQGDLELANLLEANLWLDGPNSKATRVNQATRDLFLDMNGIALAHFELTKNQEPENAWNELQTIRVPTLCIYGELDLVHLRERTLAIAGLIPNARLEIVQNAAHLPTLERDDASAPLIEHFLKSFR